MMIFKPEGIFGNKELTLDWLRTKFSKKENIYKGGQV
jgi:hypothetical protein